MMIQFKHLRLFIDRGNLDEKALIKEVFGYNDVSWKNPFRYIRVRRQLRGFVKELYSIDPDKLSLPKYSSFKVPPSIDYIPYSARVEMEALLYRIGEGDTVDEIATIVAMVCYHETTKKDFLSDSLEFKEFKYKILNSSIQNVLGVFNWIKKTHSESNMSWESRFKEVEVIDKDYLLAGGHMMQRFNVIGTIKMICDELNLDYYRAWQLPFIIAQTINLENQTKHFIQSNMIKIKESRMKSEREAQRR